jgi:sec-independent protein translocase protein TatA
VHAISTDAAMLALFNLGGGELLLLLSVVLLLFWTKNLPRLARGLRNGMAEFRRAMRHVGQEIIDGSSGFDAGQSVGGIYGKRAIEALSPDNQVSELYDPEILKRGEKPKEFRIIWYRIQRTMSAFIKWLIQKLSLH